MHEKVKIQCPILINRKGPILLHDSARPHAARMTVIKLNELGYEIPPYSPDLSPTNFPFFKHLDHFISGKSFSNTLGITNSINEFLDSNLILLITITPLV